MRTCPSAGRWRSGCARDYAGPGCRRIDRDAAASRLTSQGARSGKRNNLDDSGAAADQSGVHPGACRACRSFPYGKGRSMNYRYRIMLRPLGAADGDGWLAEVPELPGCMSDGETPQQAVENVMDAIACWIEAAEEDGRKVPAPASADAA